MMNNADAGRNVEVASTLGLGGDGDELDMLEVIERSFGVKILDQEAEAVGTVGSLFDIISAKIPADNDMRACATAMAFYRLRRAIGDRSATPRSLLRQIASDRPSCLYDRLARETGLEMPKPVPGRIGSWSIVAIVPLVIASVAATGWDYWPVLPLLTAVAAGFAWLDYRRWHGETLGELAQNVARLNFARLAESGARSGPGDAWAAFVAMLSDSTGIEAHRIARETRFF